MRTCVGGFRALFVQASGGKAGGKTLDLSSAVLPREHVKAVAEALCCDPYFTSLCFADMALGDEGTIMIAGMLRRNGTVATLDMSGNNVRHAGCVAIAEMLKVAPPRRGGARESQLTPRSEKSLGCARVHRVRVCVCVGGGVSVMRRKECDRSRIAYGRVCGGCDAPML